jgi:hypothetical protein
MGKSSFTEEQMVAAIRDADRGGVPAVAARHKVSNQTVYTWNRRFGTFQPDDGKGGAAAFAALLAPDGSILDKRPTTDGGDA